jgi:hypothetical protein
MSRLSDALSWCAAGPVIMLRVESPNMPAAGTENADVLKNSAIVGSAS